MFVQVSHIGCGYGFTVAVEAGIPRLWTTGLNTFSQLGRPQTCSDLESMMCITLFSLFDQVELLYGA